MIGSSHSQPVSQTKATPAITPMEVQTSASKWRPSASSAIDLELRPTVIRMRAVAKFTIVAKIATPNPAPTASIGRALSSRPTASVTIQTAATTIKNPSNALEKYSALPRPWA